MSKQFFKEFPGGVWLVDFEFHPEHGREGNPPVVVCLVAKDMVSGKKIRLWQNEINILRAAPFPVDGSALFVAYYSSAEISCFLSLNWALPVNVLDLYIEFRLRTNGIDLPHGKGLLGALLYFGQKAIGAEEKTEMRNLILRQEGWNNHEQNLILDYCESDVIALETLLPLMATGIDLPRALLRGRYAAAVARIEGNGIPVDTATLNLVLENWANIQANLITEVDQDFGVFDGFKFVAKRFTAYLSVNQMSWPCLPSGALDMGDETFRDMCRTYPHLSPLRELRSNLAKLRLNDLTVGDDGRNRALLSMFSSTTGRNQPSSSRFIFGPSTWFRGFIQPREGYGISYVDWSQQEFGIAAALSNDQNMMSAYHSGDPYLFFAKQASAVPHDATKDSHPEVRDQFKGCILAVQYGMGAESLAIRIQQPVARARQLLMLHQQTYRRFWQWSEAVLNHALLKQHLWTTYGWQLHVTGNRNDRSLRNFPMQANGAEMMRLACIKLIEDGIKVCAPIHDAILIEAPLDKLDAAVAHTEQIMRWASAQVLNGFELSSEAKTIRYPSRYMDKRGLSMWNLVMRSLGLPEE